MREFPEISKDTELDALQTIFFADGEFDGQPRRVCKVKYLLALSLRGPDVPDEVEKLRAELAQHPLEQIERDIGRLYAVRNWRAHLVACLALAAGYVTEGSIRALWQCLHHGSWASPQLAATAAFVDPAFTSNAPPLLADHGTYYKSIVALAGVLHGEFRITLPEGSPAVKNLAEALTIDRDNTQALALNWLASLRNSFGPEYNPASSSLLEG
jgi:tetrahydromethanopterin S-methyltransferase subunit G